MTPAERFWAKVDRSAGPDGCWLWTASITWRGYGEFWLAGRMVKAHRFAYELSIGPIPAGFTIDHVRTRGCVHRHCVNPAHLEPVTRGENVLRGDTITAANAAKTHCGHGHEFSPANTRVHRAGGGEKRECLTCRKAIHRRANERKREQRRLARLTGEV